jgi:hypothetical protein
MKKNGNSKTTTEIGPPYGLSALSRHYGVPSLGSDGLFDAGSFGQPILERPWNANIQPTLNKEGHLNTTGVRMTPIMGVWQPPIETTLFPEEPQEATEEVSWREVSDQAITLVKRLIACGVDPDVAADSAVKLMIDSTKGGGR